MTWLEGLTQVLLSAGASTIGLAILGYLARNVLTQYLARDLERYKNQFTREAETKRHEFTKELEQFKRELDGVLSERQTRFSLMHQKSAEVIAELYGRTPAAEDSIKRMTAPMRMESLDQEVEKKRRDDQQTEAAKAYESLQDYFDRHRIFLSEQAERRCEELLTHMRQAFFDFQYSRGVYTQGQRDNKKWIEAWERVTKEVPPLRAELAKDFRRILGVTD